MTMSTALKAALHAELDAVRCAATPELAFHHLERAHILSQRYTLAHVRVHGLMFRHAWRHGLWREVVGQSVRLPAALLFSKIWVPLGNTGGANVSALKPMPLPDDLKALLRSP